MAGGQNDTLANSNSRLINGCVLGFCVGLEFNSPVITIHIEAVSLHFFWAGLVLSGLPYQYSAHSFVLLESASGRERMTTENIS